MKSNKTARALRTFYLRFNPLWCLLGGALTLYLGRVAALYVLARGFEAINLNTETYIKAPAALRYLADNANAVASIVGLILGVCALVLIKSGVCALKRPTLQQLCLLLPALGFGAGFILLLWAVDEIRFLPRGALTGAIDYALWLCLAAFMALWLRGAFDAGAKWYLCYPVSMLLEATFALYLYGGFQAMLALNALLFGFVGMRLYRKTGSVLPEILLLYGYTLGHRLLSAYPGPRGYYMSANILSGGDAGLFASVFTAAMLLFILAGMLLAERKEAANGRKETVADR